MHSPLKLLIDSVFVICFVICFSKSLCDSKLLTYKEFFTSRVYYDRYLKLYQNYGQFGRSQSARTFLNCTQRENEAKALNADRSDTKSYTNQCRNGGICHNGNCECPLNYTGNFCENRRLDGTHSLNVTETTPALRPSTTTKVWLTSAMTIPQSSFTTTTTNSISTTHATSAPHLPPSETTLPPGTTPTNPSPTITSTIAATSVTMTTLTNASSTINSTIAVTSVTVTTPTNASLSINSTIAVTSHSISTSSTDSTLKNTSTLSTRSTFTTSHVSGANSGLPTAGIIGVIFGSIVAIAIFVFLLLYYRFQAQHKKGVNELVRKSSSHSQLRSYIKIATKSKGILNPSYVDSWNLEPSRLVIETDKVLGSGAFSMVYQGRIVGKAPVSNFNRTNLASKSFIDCEVAVKVPPIYADQTALSDFRQEMNLMKALGYHNHLVSLLGCSITSDGNPCIITELCSGGSLLYYVRSRKEDILKTQSLAYQNTLRFRDLLSFAWQICDAMDFLGSKGLIHRDLAARNVLINAEKTAKVGDFGLCRLMNSAVYTARGGRLPIKWMAIESLQIYEYSFKSDVWSFGVLLFELFSLGDQPYTTVQPFEMIEHLVKGSRLEKPPFCPDEIYEIMMSTWTKVPDERPSFSELRSTFTKLLESATQDYGYLQMINETSVERQISTADCEI